MDLYSPLSLPCNIEAAIQETYHCGHVAQNEDWLDTPVWFEYKCWTPLSDTSSPWQAFILTFDIIILQIHMLLLPNTPALSNVGSILWHHNPCVSSFSLAWIFTPCLAQSDRDLKTGREEGGGLVSKKCPKSASSSLQPHPLNRELPRTTTQTFR